MKFSNGSKYFYTSAHGRLYKLPINGIFLNLFLYILDSMIMRYASLWQW